ncbi:hypothetical protein [Luteimonas sp. TWI1437]|uniref:hypothetical protein n=1 Tax=unclassified Luteimonas TaxID=2629088 RepID=UPI00320AB90C
MEDFDARLQLAELERLADAADKRAEYWRDQGDFYFADMWVRAAAGHREVAADIKRNFPEVLA